MKGNVHQEVFLDQAGSSKDSTGQERKFWTAHESPAGVEKEVADLKLQLETLRCQVRPQTEGKHLAPFSNPTSVGEASVP